MTDGWVTATVRLGVTTGVVVRVGAGVDACVGVELGAWVRGWLECVGVGAGVDWATGSGDGVDWVVAGAG